jgi:hypothetical protein
MNSLNPETPIKNLEHEKYPNYNNYDSNYNNKSMSKNEKF